METRNTCDEDSVLSGLHIFDQKRKPEAKIDKMEKMKQLKNQAMNAGKKGKQKLEEIKS